MKVLMSDGQHFDFTKMTETMPTPRVIANHLAKIARWNGATTVPYSVAQHSCHVSDAIAAEAPDNPSAAMYGLLHDAHESVLGDIASPVKCLLGAALDKKLSVISELFDGCLYVRLQLFKPEDDSHSLCKKHDLRALATERRDLTVDGEPSPGFDELEPWSFRITPWDWQKAEEEWLKRFDVLYRVLTGTITHMGAA